MFWGIGNTYTDVCTTSATFTGAAIAISNVAIGSVMYCNGDATAWVACAVLKKDSANAWCTDSTVAKVLVGASKCDAAADLTGKTSCAAVAI